MRRSILVMTAAGLVFSATQGWTQSAARSVWDGVFTSAQAARGKALYEQSCESCHGTDLGGADVTPALTGPTFLGNWSGTTAGDLFDRIRTTMPQADPGSLSGRTIADIEAYIFESNRFPAASVELPSDAARMQQIRILPNKPDG